MTPVQQIKQHALDNYNNGWDYIVECYTDEEIQQEYLDVCNGDVKKAMAMIQEVADYRNEQYGEARRAVEENTDTEEEKPMTKQVNYGLHETIEGSHRTLSDAVTMYAIYYSDWTEILEELSQYYKSDEWKDSFDQYSETHRKLIERRNFIIGQIQEIGKELRSIGLDVDLCEWVHRDDLFDEVEVAA